MNLLWLLFVLAGISYVFTAILRYYAISKCLLDVPNERSSHSIPTPRGGGISIVIVFMFGLFFLSDIVFLNNDTFIAIFFSGVIISLIGFVDDHGHIPARWRLLGHFFAASWLVFWLGGFPSFYFLGFLIDLGWFGHFIIIVALVWLLNLYNFMDGIDGIASIEALSSTLVVALLSLMVMENNVIFSLCLLMFAAVSGFFIWNFPPAKIFMGDAGSGFLGLMLGAIALYSVHINPVMLWVWMIMLGVFIVDTTYTLIRRLLRGDKVYEAHCSHAYQHASKIYSSHLYVTLAVLAINLCWLGPLSYMVGLELIDGFVGVLLAYTPLILLARSFRAGDKTLQKIHN